jgi:hypothetical protein
MIFRVPGKQFGRSRGGRHGGGERIRRIVGQAACVMSRHDAAPPSLPGEPPSRDVCRRRHRADLRGRPKRIAGASDTPSTSTPPSKVRRARLTKVRSATWCAIEVAASGPTRIEAPKPRRISIASLCVAARPLSMKYLAVRCRRV